MYSLNEVLELMEAIRAKDNSDILSRKQKDVLKRAYDIYTQSMGIEDSFDAFIYKRADTYSSVFDYIYNNRFKADSLDFTMRKKVQLFKSLLHHKNKTVSLKDLYMEVYEGLGDTQTLEVKFNDSVERKNFFSELNGCIIEEMVADIDMTDFDGNDLGTIKINTGEENNPLLMVSSLNTSIMPKIDISDNEDVTILTFSDMHLDNGCFEIDLTTGLPVLNQAKLEENLLAFVEFRDKVIGELERQGVKVGGVVFTGDVFEGLTISSNDTNKPTNFVKTNRTDLMNDFIEFQNKHGDILKMPSKINDEACFVAYIAGNHDMTLGRKIFSQMMGVFREDALNLGAGSARIKIGEDFVSFIHNDALDWGLPNWDLHFTGRKARNKNTFHFNEYFDICKKCYDSLVVDKETCSTSDLVRLVSEKIKKENPELYRYFLPYTTANSILKENNSQPITTNEEMRKKINSTIPFFASYMFIEKTPPYELKKKAGGEFYPDPLMFQRFISGGVKVQEVLSKEGLAMSQYERNDSYRSILTVLGHFHKRLIGPDSGSYRFSLGEKRGKQRYFPVTVFEGNSVSKQKEDEQHFEFSATQYNFKVKNGKVAKIGVIPLMADLKKVKVDGQIKFVGELDKKAEANFNASKRH